MNTSQFWQRQNLPYNAAEVNDALRTFRAIDLADPISARRWVEFGKLFSQMSVTSADIQQMGFQNFYALKQIMRHTLAGLSDDTVRQNDRINELDEKERTLKREAERLRRIEEQNRKKEIRLEEKIANLQKEDDFSNAGSSIDHYQESD